MTTAEVMTQWAEEHGIKSAVSAHAFASSRHPTVVKHIFNTQLNDQEVAFLRCRLELTAILVSAGGAKSSAAIKEQISRN